MKKKRYLQWGYDENLYWCKPEQLLIRNWRIVYALLEGSVVGVAFWRSGRRVHVKQIEGKAGNKYSFETFMADLAANFAIEDIHTYSISEMGCRSCPWRTQCYEMDITYEDWVPEVIIRSW